MRKGSGIKKMLSNVRNLPRISVLRNSVNISYAARKIKAEKDNELAAILNGLCDKLLLIVGPCSADSAHAVIDYAAKISKISNEISDKIHIIIRVFTAKPRTTTSGYLGMIHDDFGIYKSRRLHCNIIEKTGMTTADELLYPNLYRYFNDLVSYFSIGARSSENQEHRLIASGATAAVGIKNPISGNLVSVSNAVNAAKMPHEFFNNRYFVQSSGNPLAHIVLRGGETPNYAEESIMEIVGLGHDAVVIDVSHGNSGKNY